VQIKKTDIELIENGDHQKMVISDFDDLVFENRNREYGAYQLRKRYYKVLLTCTLLASLLVIVAVLIPFVARPKSERVISSGPGYVSVQLEDLEQPEEVFIPPSPPPPEPAKIQEAVKYVPPVVVDSVSPIERVRYPLTKLASIEGDSRNHRKRIRGWPSPRFDVETQRSR
jgi:protein TonB